MSPAALLLARVPRVRAAAALAVAGLLLAIAASERPTPVAADAVSAVARREPAFVALFVPPVPAVVPVPKVPTPDMGAEAVYSLFAGQGYTLDGVREAKAEVPRLFAARLPRDLPDLDSIDRRKQVFVKMLLPLVLAENERILADRERLVQMRFDFGDDLLWALSAPEAKWLEAVAERYGVALDGPGALDDLLRRIDAVPPSLALGQAALETGWGTSPVSQRGHAMFGQMVFVGDGDRSEVRRFTHLAHAVEAYALNLNTHRAYGRFRAKRADMRAKSQTPDGYDLALALTRYSERKMDYVRDVRAIIRANKLRPLDAARLGG